MQSTFLTTESAGDVVVARLHCEKVADREAKILETELTAAAEAGGWKVAIDASEVMLLASVGLGALVNLHKACRTGGGKLVVFGITDDIRETLRLTRLDRLFLIVTDRQAALKALE